MDEGSYGAGIVLGLFLDVIGLIIALCLGKKETIKRILEHFELAKYFDEIVGSSVEENRNTKLSRILLLNLLMKQKMKNNGI